MYRFFEQLSGRIAAVLAGREQRAARVWQCRCGQSVFFRNSRCLACQAALGYWSPDHQVSSLTAGAGEGLWLLDGVPEAGAQRRCANLDTPAACNWLLSADEPHSLCLACRLTQTLPDLSIAGNAARWCKLEMAKRRLVAQLLELGLAVTPKSANHAQGLAFDFIGVDLEGNAPTTGHADGLITLDAREADDDWRERVRVQLHEPYRTLLGHMRHEVGHYYWDRLIAQSDWLEDFRALFGDERLNYAEALERHYQQGAPADWAQAHVSAYATMHPWEDWAETWAHYLHMSDALDTALALGMNAKSLDLDYPPFQREDLYWPDDPSAVCFLAFLNAWVELSAMLNELSRSMGQADFYPFVLSKPVVAKLHFIHLRIAREAP
ncbi:putative zinc-binding metallopeptidase [Pseudomonas sp. V1]|uniref:zinc-binding metallopeptidase family protein n=1 Tax=Pseudomonas arcuscaelestis TaxID=2710591 RepID=UPI00193F1982|nr:putative zinc-binding metallopeptidase [Pseudomonas arcuscaelestis]MBM3108952.1 putative zinc-binding metallopeptidase [Pseudomonas arcuscaelestis]